MNAIYCDSQGCATCAHLDIPDDHWEGLLAVVRYARAHGWLCAPVKKQELNGRWVYVCPDCRCRPEFSNATVDEITVEPRITHSPEMIGHAIGKMLVAASLRTQAIASPSMSAQMVRETADLYVLALKHLCKTCAGEDLAIELQIYKTVNREIESATGEANLIQAGRN